MGSRKRPQRLQYGARKYAAFSLLVARCARSLPPGQKYVYVTLAGTEMADLKSLHFIDGHLLSRAYAFEVDRQRHALAKKDELAVREIGIEVSILNTNMFDYDRQAEEPHIFFFDGLGIFAWSDYDSRIGKMFQRQIIREGDCVLITSHLGHRPHIDDIKKTFSGELSILGVSADREVARLFRRAHPSFTLFNALTKYRLAQELNLRCLGCIKYRDTTPMGLFGYVISGGQTDLRELVEDAGTHHFDMNAIAMCSWQDF